jgi:hypothetical protein
MLLRILIVGISASKFYFLLFSTRLETFTAVVAEKALGGNFLHFLRHGGNKFYFPPPQRK